MIQRIIPLYKLKLHRRNLKLKRMHAVSTPSVANYIRFVITEHRLVKGKQK